MRKIIVLAGIFAALSSCQKDCEKDHTAILVVNNAADERIYVKAGSGANIEVEPDKNASIEIDLVVSGSDELLFQSIVVFSRESAPTDFEEVVVAYNQCEKTEITIEK